LRPFVWTGSNEITALADLDPALAQTVEDEVKEFMGKTGENMKIGGVFVTQKKPFIYNHPGNKVATIIFFEGGNDDIAKELALQVTAMNPTYVSFEDVDQSGIASMKEEFTAELKAAGKPDAMIAQIVDGKIKKSLADVVLLEQEYIRDGAKKVKDIIPADMKVIAFVRMAI
jgi:elongation factor Ts